MTAKTKIFLAAVIILFTVQGLSFAETNKPSGKPVTVAAHPTPKVELYVTDWCPYCSQAIKFLRSKGVPYVAYDIEKDKQAAKRREKLSSQPGVPLAVINGKTILGFSERMYSQALGLK